MLNILVIDGENFSIERIKLVLSKIFPPCCFFTGVTNPDRIPVDKKLDIIFISAGIMKKQKVDLLSLKENFGAPLCKIVLISTMFEEYQKEFLDNPEIDLFIDKDKLWNFNLNKIDFETVAKLQTFLNSF